MESHELIIEPLFTDSESENEIDSIHRSVEKIILNTWSKNQMNVPRSRHRKRSRAKKTLEFPCNISEYSDIKLPRLKMENYNNNNSISYLGKENNIDKIDHSVHSIFIYINSSDLTKCSIVDTEMKVIVCDILKGLTNEEKNKLNQNCFVTIPRLTYVRQVKIVNKNVCNRPDINDALRFNHTVKNHTEKNQNINDKHLLDDKEEYKFTSVIDKETFPDILSPVYQIKQQQRKPVVKAYPYIRKLRSHQKPSKVPRKLIIPNSDDENSPMSSPTLVLPNCRYF